jgi:Xaa-Pro aminopeptidase
MSRFEAADYAGRVDAARALMQREGIDALLLSVGADLPYFTGYEAMPLERLTMAVLPRDGDVVLLVPELEAPRVPACSEVFAIEPWGETDDPVARVAGHIGPAGVLAIGEQTWAMFLLALQEHLPDARFLPAAPLTRELRMRKSAAELAALAEAGAAADRVAIGLAGVPFSGRSERSLARAVESQVVAEGHDRPWDAIVASGPNAASPHHHAGGRTITRGDTVVVDFGGSVDGYYSDTTRTYVVGEPAAEVAEAYAVLRQAQQAAVATAGPGVPAQEVDRVARSVITAAGYGEYFIHRTGHGIGLEIHEHPYLVEGNGDVLEPGMTFSVEPGIYVPRRFGMRIEDIVAVAEDGAVRLNESPRDLVVVE